MQALANIEGVHILTNKLGSNSSQPGQHFLADRIRRSTSGKFTTNVVGTMQCALMFLAGSAGPPAKRPCIRRAIALVALWNRYEVQALRLLSFFHAHASGLAMVQA
jgi:hypothetical protein